MDLADGQTIEVKGSGAKLYVIKNTAGVFSCTCPAWRNQSASTDARTCKHLRGLRGEDAERARVGGVAPKYVADRAPGAEAPPANTNGPTPPPVLLAHAWTADVDPTDWWMSEKLDGVRAYWNGTAFISRLGNEYIAPPWFTEALPPTPLDGELWMGRKRFQQCVSTVRSREPRDTWRAITFVVFDAPSAPGTFEERLEYCRRRLDDAGSHVRVIDLVRCAGVEHLRRELARVEALGGEGVMLREAGSAYLAGRSTTLLKVKTFHDGEARVVAHVAGRGKHRGRLGALVAVLRDGTRFNIGTGFSDEERRSPPSIGTLVTFRYQEMTDGGVPRFPAYVRVRADLSEPSAA